MRVFLQQKNKCNYHFLFGILVNFIILVQYRSLKASRRRPWAVAINILKKKMKINLDMSEMFSTFVVKKGNN